MRGLHSGWQDRSDERNCTTLIMPDHYSSTRPYMTVLNGTNQARPVLLNLTIQDIYSIHEQSSTFDIFFMANFRWYDQQLRYEFLKDKVENSIREGSGLKLIKQQTCLFLNTCFLQKRK